MMEDAFLWGLSKAEVKLFAEETVMIVVGVAVVHLVLRPFLTRVPRVRPDKTRWWHRVGSAIFVMGTIGGILAFRMYFDMPSEATMSQADAFEEPVSKNLARTLDLIVMSFIGLYVFLWVVLPFILNPPALSPDEILEGQPVIPPKGPNRTLELMAPILGVGCGITGQYVMGLEHDPVRRPRQGLRSENV